MVISVASAEDARESSNFCQAGFLQVKAYRRHRVANLPPGDSKVTGNSGLGGKNQAAGNFLKMRRKSRQRVSHVAFKLRSLLVGHNLDADVASPVAVIKNVRE